MLRLVQVWRRVGWSSSRQSWAERLAAVVMLLLAAATVWYGSRLALSRQVILWSILLVALGFVLRRGWVKLFGPILFYDMVRSARRGRYHGVRFLYGLVILFYFYLVYEKSGRGSAGAVDLARFAEGFFFAFMMVQFCAVFVLTPPYVAGAITDEKEQQTLEFLLATDLRNREIVLGKLAARLANLTLLLLAGLPVLGFTQFLGGVDPDLVLAGFATVAVSMLSLAALSILCSVYAAKSLNALLLSYLVAAVYLLATGLAQALSAIPSVAAFEIIGDSWNVTVDDVVVFVSAGNLPVALFKLGRAWDRGGSFASVLPGLLRDYAVFHVVVGLACLAWAVARLPAASLKQGQGTTAGERQPWLWPRPAIGRWPVLWKELHAEPGFRIGWLGGIGLAIMTLVGMAPALAIIGGSFFDGLEIVLAGRADSWREFDWSGPMEKMNVWVKSMGTILACVMFVAVAVRAAGSVTGERARTTLDSLLTTPLTTREILFGKALGSVLCMRWLWLWMGSVAALALLTGGLDLLAVPGLCAAWLIYAAFFAAVGLWCSVYHHSSLKAIMAALTALILTGISPWILIPIVILFNKHRFEGNRELASYVDFGALLSPPVTLAFLAHRREGRPFFDGYEGADSEALWCAWVVLLLIALVTVLIWALACRRLSKGTGRLTEGKGPARPLPASAPTPPTSQQQGILS